ncbi:restriction endonuclease subunit S [Aerococcus sp. HMSC062A02]|nr:restriction endonuclease subunit S [Aerococcus sanguinicola]OFN00353.1 restriction endonuclease subunit S [Aerococcus sp. HMSC062A02]OHO44985.1 restriction endonuclease subunit S [Aerococcus sp. HMSC035B07]
MCSWQKMKLEDLGKIVGGGTPSTKIASYYGGDIPWITPKDLSNNESKYISRGERNITKEGLDNSSAKILPKGTVLFSSRAPIGYIAIASQELATNQGFKSIIPNKKTTSDFLYYLLINNIENIKSQGSGSTFSEVSGRVMKNINVTVPPLKIQNKISAILSNLDQKIATNNKIIANLEAQAQAIFKSWFIDFEPFQDGEFIDSELGRIPKGWTVARIKDLSKSVVTGKTPPTKNKKFYGGSLPFITIPDMHNNTYIVTTERYLSNEGELSQPNKTIPADTICVSCIATVGLVILTSENSQTNQQINSIIPNVDYLTYYLYLTMKNSYEYLNAIGSGGSTTKNINKKSFENLSVIYPPKCYLIDFHNIIYPHFKMIKSLEQENITLSKLRDTLLPKLMSGEIDVSQISKN